MSTSARILLVDDQANMRVITGLLLRREGYRVVEAAGGAEALEQVGIEEFDLVLTDLRMEGMDGLELMARIRRISPATQVILMTAHGFEGAAEARAQGAADYVIKPFRLAELLQRIEWVLGAPRGFQR